MDVKTQIAETEAEVRSTLKKYVNDEGILDGVIQWLIIVIVLALLPGILYLVTSSTITIPSASVWNTTQSSTNSTISSSFGTLLIVPVVFAIVLIVSVLLLLGMNRRR